MTTKLKVHEDGTDRPPLFAERPKRTILSRLVEMEIKTVHYPVLQLKSELEPGEEPFYTSECEVNVFINGTRMAHFICGRDCAGNDAEHQRKYLEAYFQDHLDSEIERVIRALYAETQDRGRVSRKDLIKRRIDEERAAIRARLPQDKRGCTPWSEIVEYGRELHKMASEGEKLTATNLANRVASFSSNPLKTLRDKLRRTPHVMNFDDLLLYANLHPAQTANRGITDAPPVRAFAFDRKKTKRPDRCTGEQ